MYKIHAFRVAVSWQLLLLKTMPNLAGHNMKLQSVSNLRQKDACVNMVNAFVALTNMVDLGS